MMFFYKFFKLLEEKGMSLLEVTISAGIASAVALGTMSYMKNQYAMQKRAAERMESYTIGEYARILLLNETACTNTFSGLSLSGATASTQFDMSARPIKDSNGAGTSQVAVNQTWNDAEVLTQMYFTGYDSTVGNSGKVYMIFDFYQGGIASGSKLGSYTYTFNILVEVDGTTTVVRCFSEKLQTITETYKQICNDHMGTWTNVAAPGSSYCDVSVAGGTITKDLGLLLRQQVCSDMNGSWTGSACTLIPAGTIAAFNGACPAGWSSGYVADGYFLSQYSSTNTNGGTNLGTTQAQSIEAHTHSYTDSYMTYNLHFNTDNDVMNDMPGRSVNDVVLDLSMSSAGVTNNLTTGSTGGSWTRPLNLGVNFCLKN